MKNEITTLVNYNLWANQKLANWLLENDTNQLEQNCKSSFPTIVKTLNHIWGAQVFYLSILQQVPFQKEWDNTTKGAIQGLVKQSKEFAQHVSQLSENELQEVRTVKTKVLDDTLAQKQLIQHCMNHSTFHRGQIITMGHQLGLSKAPSTDMFFFYSETKNS